MCVCVHTRTHRQTQVSDLTRVSWWILKTTKILVVRSVRYLENGPFKRMGTTRWVYMPYFKPTIDFNMLQYITSSDSEVSDTLQVS